MVDVQDFLEIKVVQGGERKKFELTEKMLNITLKDIFYPLLKDLKLKEKDVFLSIESGKMLAKHHLNLSLREIVEQFGTTLFLYSEKIF